MDFQDISSFCSLQGFKAAMRFKVELSSILENQNRIYFPEAHKFEGPSHSIGHLWPPPSVRNLEPFLTHPISISRASCDCLLSSSKRCSPLFGFLDTQHRSQTELSSKIRRSFLFWLGTGTGIQLLLPWSDGYGCPSRTLPLGKMNHRLENVPLWVVVFKSEIPVLGMDPDGSVGSR